MCLGRELACIYATITPSSVDSLFPIFFISVYLPSIHTNLHLFILFIQHFVHVLIYFHHVGIMHAFESMLHNRVLFMHHCWYWMAYNMYTHALFSEGRIMLSCWVLLTWKEIAYEVIATLDQTSIHSRSLLQH